ncbi:MAG TPA: SMI1/KNR4 family protein [Myxococcales bacterium]|jgi:SMI1/KNR4 family protein SUKH-1
MDLPRMQLAPQGAAKEALDAIPGLPSDLRAFLERHDGGRGKVGSRPLILWSAEQIGREAQSQEVSLSTPGLLLFGTDGGAEGYGYLGRLRQRRYGRIPLIAAGAHEFEGLADSLDDLLQALIEGR